MKINRIKIDGFKNIDDVQIELNNNMLSLLSANSYGKSNFLNGIVFGFDFIRANVENKSKMMHDVSSMPLNRKKSFQDFNFEIEIKDVNDNDLIYGYSFSWKKKNDDKNSINEEYLKVKEKNSQKYSLYIKRENNTVNIKPSTTGSCSKRIKVDDNDLVINKLMAYDDLYYIDLIKIINDVNIYVDRHFNTNGLYNIETILSKNSSNYKLNSITNVPKVLFDIKRKYPNKYEMIVNTIKDIFPFIEDIKILDYNLDNINNDKMRGDDYFNIAKTVYFSLVIDKNVIGPIEISDMSDGVKRVLLIFTTLVLADINNCSLVAIEEPENSLNPKMLQRYLIALNSFSKHSNIIITSHSPYLINYLEPSSIYLGLPNEFGLAKFAKIKEKSSNKLLQDAKNMDMLIGDYLFDLMSGDESDLETIKKYTE